MSRQVPEADHVARYCKPTNFAGGELQASAFLLRRNVGEKGLSTNWLEYLDPTDRTRQLEKLRKAFAGKKFSIAAGAKFAVLNVGVLKRNVSDGTGQQCRPDVTHLPQADDPSHAGILGIVNQDELVAELVLQAVTLPLYPARG